MHIIKIQLMEKAMGRKQLWSGVWGISVENIYTFNRTMVVALT